MESCLTLRHNKRAENGYSSGTRAAACQPRGANTMISTTGTLTDFDAFRKTLREFHPDEGNFFRRVRRSYYELIPKIGRLARLLSHYA